jgi:hypothetical protein
MSPREYLSWSSMDLLERSEEKWIEQYIYGKRNRINRGMAFGKVMADSLETSEASGDIMLDLTIERIPKFEIMDQPFTADLKVGKKIIQIHCRPDTMKKDMSAFKEYKTGQEAWSQKKVDNNGQVTFYTTGMFLKTGKIPQDIELVHIETEKENMEALDSKLRATGEIKRYKTVRTMSQVINMMVRMKKAWARIEELTEKELL